VLKRHTVHFPRQRSTEPNRKTRSHNKLPLPLVGIAIIALVFGIGASLQTIRIDHINRSAAAQVAALSRKAHVAATAAAAAVASASQPTPTAVSNYVVAPNLPRYLMIPKLGVDARVMQVGVTTSGALGTPNNIFDTAWYTGSAEPGQSGATLIDGHVSSSTSHGVFYGLKTLELGDSIQIVRGDGTIFNYQVMKTQVYTAGNVNMQAAMTPITPGTPGLNLITGTGDVIPGASSSNERIIVFAKQI
jgi:sortase (surface protein transpeptidase)